MFNTPPKRVYNLRNTTRRRDEQMNKGPSDQCASTVTAEQHDQLLSTAAEQQEMLQQGVEQQIDLPSNLEHEPEKLSNIVPEHLQMDYLKVQGSSVKSEAPPPPREVAQKSLRAGSCKSSRKSIKTTEIKRKELQLQAEKQKAKILMNLIDKEFEVRAAQLEEYSSQSEDDENGSFTEEWVKNQIRYLDLEKRKQSYNDGKKQGELPPAGPAHAPAPPYVAPGPAPAPTRPTTHPPPQSADSVGALIQTVQMLVNTVNDLTTAKTTSPNASLLSRISTPKDLPEFSGDPMEWLQFKQAYQESTEVCKFSEKENLWRLRKCLRGAAKEAVAALFISATSPDKVMSTLQLRFGNPDCIISKILHDIKKLQALSQDYQKEIVSFSVKVQNFVEAVRSVGREEYLQGISIVSIILSKLPAVLVSKWSDYSYKLISDGKIPRLIILSNFLSEEAVKISTTASIFTSTKNDQIKGKSSHEVANRSHTILLQADENAAKCLFCRTSKHKLTDCKQFKKSLRKVRWQFVKRNGLCYKCITSRHERDTCPAPVCDKDGCGQAHHRLLHYSTGTRTRDRSGADRQQPTSPPSSSATSEMATAAATTTVSGSPTTETVTHINVGSERKVLLKVVPLHIHGPKGVISTTALLDDGSTVSLISAELAGRAGLRGRRETMRVRGAWTDNELVCESTVVNVTLSSMDQRMHVIRARSVAKLDLPMQSLSVINCNNYVHLHDLKDDLCTSDLKPEILIGQDNHHLLLPLQMKLGKSNEPSATLTPLGWCVHGSVSLPQGAHKLTCRPADDMEAALFIADCEVSSLGSTGDEESLLRDIHEEVRRSFALDSIGVTSKPRQNENDVRAIAHLEKTAKLIDRRWYVGLPWKDESCKMPDARPNALKRLKGIERKMEKDTGFAKRYEERVNHLLENDFARVLDDIQSTPRTWYLPHFGVDNPNKKKLRLVFDAADKVSGNSLNDYLLTGPDLLSSLFGIMLRFRENKIAVTGDIKDMFLRVKIRPEDQNALRFLWRSNPTEEIKTYAMTSLIFGANCSPFVAQFVKNKNAQRFESSLPAAVEAIYTSHYMDDYIDSLEDETTAIEMVRNITNIYKEGGFEIRNWTSNSVAVLNSVPNETLGTAAVRFKVDQQYEGERTLGLIWYPGEDNLAFDVSLKRIPQKIIADFRERPTKRLMLRIIMSIFDVLGFLTPFTVQGRIMLQDTWRLNIGWDDCIPDDIYEKWCRWVDLLKDVDKVRIPRCYHMTACASETEREPVTGPLASPAAAAAAACAAPRTFLPPGASTQPATSGYESVAASTSGAIVPSYNDLHLHMFCDASTKAMCAVGYWRWIDNNGKVKVALIASKCRVVPIKPITVPRAELQAALLAARLADTISREHKLTPVRRYFWCDSTTVLHWVYNNTRKYKTFVANRLGEIDELSQPQEWRYIPTHLNVADLATRESFDQKMFKSEWFTGPKFLYLQESTWPIHIIQPEPNEDNLECVAVIKEFTAAERLVPEPQRFSSWLRLLRSTAFMLKFIDKCRKLTGDIDCSTMERAERLLLKYAQAESFAEEIAAIKNGKRVSSSSKLLTLSPFLDEHGVLRVGGRIDAAENVTLEVKRPIILEGRHPVSLLIVRHYHVKAAHGNQETVVNELKQRYWIIRLRPTVKSVVSKCMLCRIRKCKPQVPRMGDLPNARLAHHQRPFTHCGLDLFGPLQVVVGRRREKRYGVLFTCMTVRAVHIELVASLTSDSLIMALRRMAARRGWPRHLYSDNGTNLRGTNTELKKSIEELDTEVLKNEGINNGMEWSFIPPGSPHWGGAWERLIRSVKTSLKVILNERAPRDEVLSTLMAEVENIVNSRPLMHVSVELGDVESLTPNHFLLGTSSNLPIIGAFDDSDLYLRKHWRTAQRLADMYWKRWVKEILPDLLPRKKWHDDQKPLQIGDLVLIVDPDSPRNVWPRGLVTQIFPGKDGRVRLVEVKTKSGTWRRSAARVARIPLE